MNSSPSREVGCGKRWCFWERSWGDWPWGSTVKVISLTTLRSWVSSQREEEAWTAASCQKLPAPVKEPGLLLWLPIPVLAVTLWLRRLAVSVRLAPSTPGPSESRWLEASESFWREVWLGRTEETQDEIVFVAFNLATILLSGTLTGTSPQILSEWFLPSLLWGNFAGGLQGTETPSS